MRFQANIDTAKMCFDKYKLNAFLYVCFFVFVALGNVVSTYQRYHHLLFTIFFTMLTLAIFFGAIYSTYRGSISMNRSVESVEITTETINFQTFTATMFWGLVKKGSMNIEVPRKQFDFKLSPTKYGFSPKYAGDVYLLSYAGDDYLIESNFFEDFSELKRNLENNIEN